MKHYQEPLNLNDVADEFHYTSAHLSRMFKEHIGYNFYAYIQNVRLMHCMEEMKNNPDVRLLECAISNGFLNVKFLCFRRVYLLIFSYMQANKMS